MTKVINEQNQVAVLIHPCHGAGWSTWAEDSEKLLLLFDPQIVEIVLEYHKQAQPNIKEMKQEILKIAALKGYESYMGGAAELAVQWVPQGVQFRVKEYDGYETLELRDNLDWIIA